MDEKEKREMRLKQLEIFHQLGYDAVFERYKLLPQISALSATLLVVATFNEKLLPLTNFIRVLLMILLALIPICLVGYAWVLKRVEEHALRNIERISEGQETIPQKQNLITAYLPWFVTIVISVVIFIVIVFVFTSMENFFPPTTFFFVRPSV